MDSDAFASFVNVDMVAIQPDWSLGFIADTRYMDVDDNHGTHPRQGLDVFQRGVTYFRSKCCGFVCHLGNVLAAENASASLQWTALQALEAERQRMGSAQWHFTLGPADYACFGKGAIEALKASRDGTNPTYYATFPAAFWRLVVLDALEAATTPDPIYGLGEAQLTWLGAQLSAACAANERVILVSHLPLQELSNAHAVEEKMRAHPGVVVAVLSSSVKGGFHRLDGAGIHHLAPHAASGLRINDNSFGVLHMHSDKLVLEMEGVPPNAELNPLGWPAELALPRTGQLTIYESNGQLVARFVALWIFALHMMLAPLKPLVRMITSQKDSAPKDGEADGQDADDVSPDEPGAIV